MDDVQNLIQLAGTVENVIFQNEENGYTVLRLAANDGRFVTVVGCLPFAAPGEHLILEGAMTRHPSHGAQFQTHRAQRIMPRGAEAIFEYLASRAVRGIGPATASLIVNTFGDKSLEVLENEPEKLSEIRGISLKKANEISENFRRQTGLRRLMEFLNSHEIPTQLAMRLYKYYGDNAMELLRANPYILSAEHIGGSFAEADALALALNFESDCAERISAAILFELTHNSRNGHCFIPRPKLIAATAQLIEVPEDAVEEGLDILTDSGEVVISRLAGLEACYLERLFEAETETAARLRDMAEVTLRCGVDVDKLIARAEKSHGITYAPLQRQVLTAAATRQLCVLTGGPGTGKTTCVRAVLELFDALGLETVLAAPTGRAAKRLSELTGRDAATVHRLLEAGYNNDELIFRRDASNPLKCHAVILDECSMVDITLLHALLEAMPGESRLVMVGDADQLPSVGPGNVFSDVIRSECAETVRLTEIFRQKQESRIIRHAHAINGGQHPPLSENRGDFFFLKRKDPHAAADTVVELCEKRLPNNMGIDVNDIQVLTPSRKTETGCIHLNARLQAALNPPAPGKNERRFGEIVFREGDRIMQKRNSYDMVWRRADGNAAGLGIFNGDIGRIISVNNDEESLTIDFDDRIVHYPYELLGDIEHAFAMTVHKSQGSEYRAVVLAIGRGAPQLFHRGLLYTAITRARELLVLVGDDELVAHMIDNYRQTRRYSGLRLRLIGQAED